MENKTTVSELAFPNISFSTRQEALAYVSARGGVVGEWTDWAEEVSFSGPARWRLAPWYRSAEDQAVDLFVGYVVEVA